MGLFDFLTRRKGEEAETKASTTPDPQTSPLNTAAQAVPANPTEAQSTEDETAANVKEAMIKAKRIPGSLKNAPVLAPGVLPLNTQLAVILRRGEEVLATVSGAMNVNTSFYDNLLEKMNKNDGLYSLPIADALKIDYYEIPRPASGPQEATKIWVHPRFESRGLTKKIQAVLAGASGNLKAYDNYEVASASKLGYAVFSDVTQMYAYLSFAEKARSPKEIEYLTKLIDAANGEHGYCYVGYEPVSDPMNLFSNVPYLSEEEFEERDIEPDRPWPFERVMEGFYVHRSIVQNVKKILERAKARKKAGDSGENSNSQQSAA